MYYYFFHCKRNTLLLSQLDLDIEARLGIHQHLALFQAVSEIQNLVGTSKCLERQKKRLKEMQSVYVKEISRLSGGLFVFGCYIWAIFVLCSASHCTGFEKERVGVLIHSHI